MRDFELEAQKAAEAHLAACTEAMFAWEEAGEVDESIVSPAIAPFCGCDTCVVREVLYAAWPIMEQGVLEKQKLPLYTVDQVDRLRAHLEEIQALPGQTLVTLQIVGEALAADDVRAEEEDQNQSGGDDREHDVLP